MSATDVPTQKVVNFLTRGLSERADRIMELGNSQFSPKQTPSTSANGPRNNSSQANEEHQHWDRAIDKWSQIAQRPMTVDPADSQKPTHKIGM